jgi:hypothetical protein
MTAEELHALLVRLGACPEAIRWARGKTLATAWRTCPRGDWMEWLAFHVGVRVTAAARAKYVRVRAAAWAKYDRVEAPARAEYERVREAARAKSDRVRAAAYRKAVPYRVIAAALKGKGP